MSLLESAVEPGGTRSQCVVLCVDDDPGILQALKRNLGDEPYCCLLAGGAQEALDVLDRCPVRIIVADERMPGMTGTELLEEARRLWPKVGRIILTGYPAPEPMLQGLEGNVDYLLSKPWDERVLRRTIQKLIGDLDRRRGKDELDESWRDPGGEGG